MFPYIYVHCRVIIEASEQSITRLSAELLRNKTTFIEIDNSTRSPTTEGFRSPLVI